MVWNRTYIQHIKHTSGIRNTSHSSLYLYSSISLATKMPPNHLTHHLALLKPAHLACIWHNLSLFGTIYTCNSKWCYYSSCWICANHSTGQRSKVTEKWWTESSCVCSIYLYEINFILKSYLSLIPSSTGSFPGWCRHMQFGFMLKMEVPCALPCP